MASLHKMVGAAVVALQNSASARILAYSGRKIWADKRISVNIWICYTKIGAISINHLLDSYYRYFL